MDINSLMTRFYENEQVGSARKFAKLLHIRNPSKERDFILAYTYARELDDIVDSGKNPLKTKDILHEQRTLLNKLSKDRGILVPSSHYEEIINFINKIYGSKMIDLYSEMVSGFEIDNNIIISGNPINEMLLNKRHLTQTLVPLKMLSLIAFDKELDYSSQFENLSRTWATYDALIDIKEDLEAGLILFSLEDLVEEKINFYKEEPINPTFKKVISKKKKETLKNLIFNSSAVKETNLPLFERESLRIYFLSRVIKLYTHNCNIPESLRYGINLTNP